MKLLNRFEEKLILKTNFRITGFRTSLLALGDGTFSLEMHTTFQQAHGQHPALPYTFLSNAVTEKIDR